VTRGDESLDTLESGDVVLLLKGWTPGASGPSQRFIEAAIEHAFPVEPVPGPALPITALVISGLPADSFVYLGQLPQTPAARQDLLTLVAGERRTLVALVSPDHLGTALAESLDSLGNRPLVVVTASETGTRVAWRGTVSEAGERPSEQPTEGLCVLIVGGEREPGREWEEEQLRAEVMLRLERGLGVKEISRQLAVESGWPRREVYRLAVEITSQR
jgi:16S rRNA (cytidine1402-2'-O)-methyltransferase